MDLQTIYPASITPKFLISIKEFYIETYHDQFFVSPPIYFQLFIWLELAVHVPVSFWAVGALLKGESELFFFCLFFGGYSGAQDATSHC
jgi:hypothetical protein